MERQALTRCAALLLAAALLLLPLLAAACLAPQQAKAAFSALFALSAACAAPDGAAAAAGEWFSQALATLDTPAQAYAAGEAAAAEGILPAEAPAAADVEAVRAAIPEQRRGVIEEVHYAGSSTASDYFFFGEGCVRNATGQASEALAAVAAEPLALPAKGKADEPRVLIVHTHTTESYERYDAGVYDSEAPTRSTDPAENMVAVGEALCARLAQQGVAAVHACECHDYPSYNGSYARSRETIDAYLERYPSVTVVLDLHRDGIERQDGTRVKPTAVVNGRKAAQLMLIACADDGSGLLAYWRENLRFAARLQDALQRLYPGLARPVLFDEREYNQDRMPGILLVEVGSQSSTLDEAKYAAQLLGDALAAVLAAV